MRIFREETNFNFLGKRWFCYILSASIIIFGIVIFSLNGKKNFSFEFRGGSLFRIKFEKPISSLDEIRKVILEKGWTDISLQKVGKEGDEIILRCGTGKKDLIPDLKAKLPSFSVIGEETISPIMGRDICRKGILAFIYGMIGILLYTAFRFEWRFGICGVIAIFHDLLIITAFLTFFQKQIDTKILAALLAIAGYSINDTIVIFDRIRENIRQSRKKEDYTILFNRSINQNLTRTMLTSLTTLFVVLSIFFFGGPVLHNFAFALFIGIISGTYSSIYIASALLIDWERKSPHRFKL